MIRSCLILLFVFILSCSKNNNKQFQLEFDTTKIAILDAGKLDDFKKYKSAKLNNEDLIEIERLLKLSVINYNSNQIMRIPNYQKKYPDIVVKEENVTINLDNYKRQYIPYINENGEKLVWVYCIINTRVHKQWEKEVLYAAGGGDSYFWVTINLNSKTQKDFSINGPA